MRGRGIQLSPGPTPPSTGHSTKWLLQSMFYAKFQFRIMCVYLDFSRSFCFAKGYSSKWCQLRRYQAALGSDDDPELLEEVKVVKVKHLGMG